MPSSITYRHTAAGMEHKCSSCHRWKAANTTIFAADQAANNGLGAHCRKCAAERMNTPIEQFIILFERYEIHTRRIQTKLLHGRDLVNESQQEL